ncbi:MAG: glycosyltransferase family 2 protein [Thermoprotei archaeon]
MARPLLSVIIPVYKEKQRLASFAISSALSQTLDRSMYEVIVVSNVSLPEVKGVTVIESANRWLGPKMAEGVTAASGDIVSFLEYDDLFYPNKLEQVLHHFASHKDLAFYWNGQTFIGEDGRELAQKRSSKRSGARLIDLSRIKKGDLEAYEMIKKATWNASSMSVRREVIAKYLPMLEQVKISGDSPLMVAAALSGGYALVDEEPLTKFRVYPYRTDLEIEEAFIHDYLTMVRYLKECGSGNACVYLKNYYEYLYERSRLYYQFFSARRNKAEATRAFLGCIRHADSAIDKGRALAVWSLSFLGSSASFKLYWKVGGGRLHVRIACSVWAAGHRAGVQASIPPAA